MKEWLLLIRNQIKWVSFFEAHFFFISLKVTIVNGLRQNVFEININNIFYIMRVASISKKYE